MRFKTWSKRLCVHTLKHFGGRIPTLLSVAMLCSAQVHASTPSKLHLELLKLDQALQHELAAPNPEVRSTQRRTILERFAHLEQLTDRPESGDMKQKFHMLEGLKANMELLANGKLEPLPLTAATDYGPLPENSCESAIALPTGSDISARLSALGSYWIRVEAGPSAPMVVSTRGSALDTRIDVFEDCRELTPIDVQDDNYGLQAEVAIAPRTKSDWLLRITNQADQGGALRIAIRGSGIFRGRVTAEDTSLPLSRRVQLYRVDQGFASYQGEVTTSTDGNYVFGFSNDGGYALRTSRMTSSPYLDEAFQDKFCFSSFGFSDCSYDTVTLAVGETRVIDFTLSRGGNIAVRVLSTSGLPMEFSEARVFFAGNSIGATTDDSGRALFSGLRPGTHRLTASAFGHETQLYDGINCPQFCDFQFGTPIEVSNGTTQSITMNLRPTNSLTILTAVDGQAPTINPSLSASLFNSNGVQVASTSNGRFSQVPAGSYYLRASSTQLLPQLFGSAAVCASEDCLSQLAQATLITVLPASGNQSITIGMRSRPRISGTVTEAATGSPIPNVEIVLRRPGSFNSVTTLTDIGGNYSLAAPSYGTYVLSYRSSEHVDELHADVPCEASNPDLSCSGATLLSFDANTVSRVIDNRLQRSSSISGLIPDSGELFVYSVSGQLLARRFLSGPQYRASDLPTGPIKAVFRSGQFLGTFAQLYFNIDCASNSESSCPLGAGLTLNAFPGQELRNIDFSPRPANATRVRLTDRTTGLPLSGAAVDVWSLDREHRRAFRSRADGLVFITNFDNLGNPSYLVSTDAPGYFNQVHANIQCPFGSAFFGLCSLAGATPITISESLPIIEFNLQPNDGRIFRNSFE